MGDPQQNEIKHKRKSKMKKHDPVDIEVVNGENQPTDEDFKNVFEILANPEITNGEESSLGIIMFRL